MSKHTPAPWKMYKTPNDADFVAEIEGIASVYAASGDALANARLIAAAPDLYAFAKLCARLNPDAGEIGPGMLAQLVAEARRIVGED